MNKIIKQLEALRIVPVVVIENADDAVPLAKALVEGGLPCAEVTFRTAAGKQAIARMAKAYPELILGAGTVLTTEQVDQAVEAGASFIVSPGLNPKIVQYCLDRKISIIPGCNTPSDIESALELGLKVVKFFPAEPSGGLKMIRALAAAYVNIRFMPTGGINQGNIREYLSYDKIIACGGSWMVEPALIRAGKFDQIRKLVKEAVRLRLPDASGMKSTISHPPFQKKTGKVVTMGEIMMRLSPPGHERFLHAGTFDVHYGGAEANVAATLAGFGHSVQYVTKLPDQVIGDQAVAALRKRGVGCKFISRGGNRLGLYFLENGASVRPSKVVYDRSGSSIAEATAEDFDFDTIFGDAELFHISGITPVLSDSLAAVVKTAVVTAKRNHVTISFDMNYRAKLWDKKVEEKQKCVAEILPYVDICFGNPLDAAKMCGYSDGKTDFLHASYADCIREEAMAEMLQKYNFQHLVTTCRESYSASHNGWAALMFDGSKQYQSKHYDLQIVDRVGGGDAFAAGFLHGILTGMDYQKMLEFATAAAAIKHTIPGDVCDATVAEVENLISSKGTGRVVR